jgi:hypothetical protein
MKKAPFRRRLGEIFNAEIIAKLSRFVKAEIAVAGSSDWGVREVRQPVDLLFRRLGLSGGNRRTRLRAAGSL